MPFLRVVACADLDPERARQAATVAGADPTTPDELVARDDVEVVLNLTPPNAHATALRAALDGGKHAYGEKPLTVDRAAAADLVVTADRAGLRLGGAPDTFLGPIWQKARELVDAGAIGRPVAARATFLSHGVETWHPNPGFFYQPGGGPVLDMAPYYLTTLVSLVGPIRRVSGAAAISFPTRAVTSEPRAGEVIEVTTPTHVAALLEFDAGAVGTLVTSFDIWEPEGHAIEVYGSEGTLHLPDPNLFDGELLYRGTDMRARWHRIPPSDRQPALEGQRGLGLGDFVLALREGRQTRANAALPFHVLDTMLSILESAEAGRAIDVGSTCEPPAPLEDDTKERIWPSEWLTAD
jgi:predicted dehydrogenase